ncbi:MAG: hypothetical protein WBE17_16430 [Anaerolineae bacterium]
MACLAVPGAGASLHHQALGDLPGIAFMPEAPWGRCNRWLTVITVDPAQFGADREAIRLALEAENIEARPLWKPMHRPPTPQLWGEFSPAAWFLPQDWGLGRRGRGAVPRWSVPALWHGAD